MPVTITCQQCGYRCGMQYAIVMLSGVGTPNGWKISVLLKELKYPHSVKHLSLKNNEQKGEAFLKINPNGRIPAIGA